MQITLRLEQILTAIAACPFVESRNISFEERPPDAGYISGAISFTDASILHVKEYLIFKSSAMSIVKFFKDGLHEPHLLQYSLIFVVRVQLAQKTGGRCPRL